MFVHLLRCSDLHGVILVSSGSTHFSKMKLAKVFNNSCARFRVEKVTVTVAIIEFNHHLRAFGYAETRAILRAGVQVQYVNRLVLLLIEELIFSCSKNTALVLADCT